MTLRDRITERMAGLVFDHRRVWLILFTLVTVALGLLATRIGTDAGFAKMIPLEHPYMQTFTAYQKTFGGANRVLVALVRKDGKDIFTPDFFDRLKNATDDVFFIPGVERTSVASLFTPNVRFIEITEEGFAGGNVISSTFQNTPEDLEKVRSNIQKSSEFGRLVSRDFNGVLIRAELLEHDPQTGAKLDYFKLAQELERIRAKYESPEIGVHIIGFAKAVDDIRAGAIGVLTFFLAAFLITAVLLYAYTRSTQVTGLALVCALVPVIWLFGLLKLLGYGIDPMSILVPFLIFSIGVSHAVQMTNAWRLRRMGNRSSLEAAQDAFRSLFVPGALALATNALGFLVIMLIKIEIVRELGITASLGVALMIVTNKILLPILLSYLTVRPTALQRAQHFDQKSAAVWEKVARLADRRHAGIALLIALLVTGIGAWKARDLKTGDLGQGIPELRQTSRYNQDNAAITKSFAIGVDVLGVVVQTHDTDSACTKHEYMEPIERFEWEMRRLPGVQSVLSTTTVARMVNGGVNEGNLKWRALPRDPAMMAQVVGPLDTASGLIDTNCNVMQVLIFTRDHQGETIARIVDAVKRFNAHEDHRKIEFKLATGNVGVMAATNEAVDAAEYQMLGAIFGVLALLCYATFRSVAAVVCILLPLALVSILCNALMASLGIGLKVSTLPVIALGVGVGVDYGIYLYDTLQHRICQGASLAEACVDALRQRGAAAMFTALTMTVGVGSWAFSALKFQADMGVLLAFMFLVNALAALVLLPSLAAWLYPTQGIGCKPE